LKAKGIDEVCVVCVNDFLVAKAWKGDYYYFLKV
jgi:peroxiredoxin